MGKVNFGKDNTLARKQPSQEAETIIVERIVEVPVEVIKEIEVIKEVIKEVPIIKVETIEVIKEVVKEVEVPVVVTKIEIVEVEKPVDRIIEKVITVLDSNMLLDERKKNIRLENKIKQLYVVLACMIVISMIMVVR